MSDLLFSEAPGINTAALDTTLDLYRGVEATGPPQDEPD